MNDVVTTDNRLSEIVDECQDVMAHAWMVRTFVKHNEKIEDFPKLIKMVRSVFDTSRALETRLRDPANYIKMLNKKIGRMRRAAKQFRQDTPLTSTHTNFQQTVRSLDLCVDHLKKLLSEDQDILSA